MALPQLRDPPKPARLPDGRIDMQNYCCNEIDIPPVLPGILKEYTKAALRTQPRDLLQWSATYFRALSRGEAPLVKDRLENPMIPGRNGLTPGLLRVLQAQFGPKENVTLAEMKEKWKGICMNPEDLEPMLKVADLGSNFRWPPMLALAAASIGQNLSDTMRILCIVLTDQPDGREPLIKFDTWWSHYTFLARIANVPEAQIQKVHDYLSPIAADNLGTIGPSHFLKQECPELLAPVVYC